MQSLVPCQSRKLSRVRLSASATASSSALPGAGFASRDVDYMQQALAQAERAMREGEVPVGAVLVRDYKVVCAAHNRVEQLRDPTAHAEMLCLRAAANLLGAWSPNKLARQHVEQIGSLRPVIVSLAV